MELTPARGVCTNSLYLFIFYVFHNLESAHGERMYLMLLGGAGFRQRHAGHPSSQSLRAQAYFRRRKVAPSRRRGWRVEQPRQPVAQRWVTHSPLPSLQVGPRRTRLVWQWLCGERLVPYPASGRKFRRRTRSVGAGPRRYHLYRGRTFGSRLVQYSAVEQSRQWPYRLSLIRPTSRRRRPATEEQCNDDTEVVVVKRIPVASGKKS